MQQAFAHPGLLFALSALPVVSVLAFLAARRRQQALVRMAGLVGSVPDAALGAGTRIGAALVLAADTFDGRSAAARDVLLLSDGDDPARDGEWRKGVERARADGVAVHVVGVGDPGEGHRVPDGGG